MYYCLCRGMEQLWLEFRWRRKNVATIHCERKKSFPSAPCTYCIIEVHPRFELCQYYVSVILSVFLISSYCVQIHLHPCYVSVWTCSKFNCVLLIHKDDVMFLSVSPAFLLPVHCPSSYFICSMFWGHSGNIA